MITPVDETPVHDTDWKQAITPAQLKALKALGAGYLYFRRGLFRQQGGFHCKFTTLAVLYDLGLAIDFKVENGSGYQITQRGHEVLMHLQDKGVAA